MSTSLIIFFAAMILFVLLLLYSKSKMKKLENTPDSEKIVKLSNSNFKQQIRTGLVLVDFWAPWCGPCKIMLPVLNEVAEEMDGKAKIAKLNVDHNQPIASQYKVRGIPTLILFKDGKEIERFVGVKQKGFLVKELLKQLG